MALLLIPILGGCGNKKPEHDEAGVIRLVHRLGVSAMAFGPDGKHLATAGGTSGVWDPTAGEELVRFRLAQNAYNVAFSPDGKRVATAGGPSDRTARIWDATAGAELARLVHPEWVFAVAISPDGKLVATEGNDSVVRVWSWQTQAP